jgi:hypothetical protein
MDLRLELVIGFALLLLVGVPAVVVRIIEARSRRASPLPRSSGITAALTAKPESEASGRTCPYCKDAIAPAAVHIECATCKTWHHPTCFEENGGCSVFGCKEKKGVGRAERTG